MCLFCRIQINNALFAAMCMKNNVTFRNNVYEKLVSIVNQNVYNIYTFEIACTEYLIHINPFGQRKRKKISLIFITRTKEVTRKVQ